MRTYDLRTAQMYTEDIIHPITSFSISNDGTTIAASCLDGIIRQWGCATNTTRMESQKRVYQKLHSSHQSNKYKVECTFTSNDEYVVSGSECGAVAIYPANNDNAQQHGNNNDTVGKQQHNNATILQGHVGPTCSVAACPQTSRPWLLVSASYDGTAVVWASQAHFDCCA